MSVTIRVTKEVEHGELWFRAAAGGVAGYSRLSARVAVGKVQAKLLEAEAFALVEGLPGTLELPFVLDLGPGITPSELGIAWTPIPLGAER